jgi:hypothetical protein
MTNRKQTGSWPKPSCRALLAGDYLEVGSSAGLTAVRLEIGSSKPCLRARHGCRPRTNRDAPAQDP